MKFFTTCDWCFLAEIDVEPIVEATSHWVITEIEELIEDDWHAYDEFAAACS